MAQRVAEAQRQVQAGPKTSGLGGVELHGSMFFHFFLTKIPLLVFKGDLSLLDDFFLFFLGGLKQMEVLGNPI